jgi:hypothetical protein
MIIKLSEKIAMFVLMSKEEALTIVELLNSGIPIMAEDAQHFEFVAPERAIGVGDLRKMPLKVISQWFPPRKNGRVFIHSRVELGRDHEGIIPGIGSYGNRTLNSDNIQFQVNNLISMTGNRVKDTAPCYCLFYNII